MDFGRMSSGDIAKAEREANIVNKRLNIGYNFKENSISKFLIGSSKIDFIGGNGKIYAGEIINLELNEDYLQRNLFKTLALFEALEKTFPKRFSPSECKMLVLESQAFNPEKSNYMDKLNTWHDKAGYGLVIKSSLDDFQNIIETEVEAKNIKPYVDWVKEA